MNMERLDSVLSKGDGANCNGTALYLAGVLKEDTFVHPRTAYDYLKWFPKLEQPDEGCLVVWRSADWVSHMAVVVKKNPTRVTHRKGYDGSLDERVSLEEIKGNYGRCEIEFYRPRRSLVQRLYRVFTGEL